MAKQARFEIFQNNQKYVPGVVFDEKPKTGLGFEIRKQQQKCWCKHNLQSVANPAVVSAILKSRALSATSVAGSHNAFSHKRVFCLLLFSVREEAIYRKGGEAETVTSKVNYSTSNS